MNFIKSIGIELLFIGGAISLFFMYISGVKKEANKNGKLEKTLDDLRNKQTLLTKVRRAQREFGSKIEDLENDDSLQFKGDKTYTNVKIENITDNPCNIECVQFKDSPFKRN